MVMRETWANAIRVFSFRPWTGFHALKVLALFRDSSNEYAEAFANDLDRRFQSTTGVALAPLSCMRTVEGFAWLSDLNTECHAQDDNLMEDMLDNEECRWYF
jgi:hypothetical protein